MLNRSNDSEHNCLVLILRGNAFNYSSFSMMLVMGLKYIAVIILRYVLCTPSLLKVLIMKGSLVLLNAFSASNWDNHIVFVLSIVYIVDHVYWFAYAEPSLNPQNKDLFIMVNCLFWCTVGLSLLVFCGRFLHLCSSGLLACSCLSLLLLLCPCLILLLGLYWIHRMS